MDKCREEFEKHFLSLKFATEGVAQTVLDACTFDKDQNVYLPNMEWFLHNDDQEGVVYCSMLNTCYMSFQSRQTEVDELQNLYTQQGINMLKLQKRVDELQTAFKQLIEMENESISFEHDLFDKGWNQSARQTIENIYKLTGLGEQALKGGFDE
ncbi:hypothetical protein HF304_03660 [Acinetobacter baumannii]|uniref:hypothetical protein n=1 Tax=Acinetobacter baumannii TaxID=470 RepID=UPI00068EA452|nr:hypothetical protein [Acinetobacter baumannii]MBP4936990.1 hypothetical protein [Acinetobacter baumannii]MBP4981577.1 hypothetical protein [Acinetobacter baumannii]NKN68931.1 hypothetical protein [Acinetobacter baumannii]NKN91339.1 hypothetical protein [Acinetobacter baumannii]HAV2832689.1 hypothetical protein [Acinetobacter baumannii]